MIELAILVVSVLWISIGATLVVFSASVLMGGGGRGEESVIIVQMAVGFAMLVSAYVWGFI